MESKEADALPFFLQKLWQIVCDPSTDHLIAWSEDGKSFFVIVPEQFSHDVLPQYFKHRNFSSFVRQLNMYGFHKLVSTENGLTSNGEEIGFSHPFFEQDKPELLDQIKRKVNARNVQQVVQHTAQMSRDELNTMMKSLHELKSRQDQVVNALSSLTRDKDGLWTEVLTLRQQVTKQDAVIKKLLGFIGQCVTQGSLPMKRPHLAISQVGDFDGPQYKVGSMSGQYSPDEYTGGAASVAQPTSMSSSTIGDDMFVRPTKVTMEDDNDIDELDFLLSPGIVSGMMPDLLAAEPGIMTHASSSSTVSSVAAPGGGSMAAAAAAYQPLNAAADSADPFAIVPPKDCLNPKCIQSCGEHIDHVQLGIDGMQKYLSNTTLDPTAVDQLFDPTDLLGESAEYKISNGMDPFTGVAVASPPMTSAPPTVTASRVQQP